MPARPCSPTPNAKLPRDARRLGAVTLGAALFALTAVTNTEAQQIGAITNLPLPRYVSLKSDRVNLREGPSKAHPTTWIFERAGLPVEITGEFDTWRKVRDSEGSEGWVLHSLLSGRRTALVAPWKKGETFTLFSGSNPASPAVASLQAGVIGNVQTCSGTWCRIYGEGFDGYIQQADLWGVYPNEIVP